MTSIAPDIAHLLQLDEGTREAWAAYNGRLRELSGSEYENAESESWDELQSELRRIQLERESLTSEAS